MSHHPTETRRRLFLRCPSDGLRLRHAELSGFVIDSDSPPGSGGTVWQARGLVADVPEAVTTFQPRDEDGEDGDDGGRCAVRTGAAVIRAA